MKLNNKGQSAIEILICFTIVSIISISLFNLVMSYKNKQQIESTRAQVINYKNDVTTAIQSDMVKYFLDNVTCGSPVKKTIDGISVDSEYSCTLTFRGTGGTRNLFVSIADNYISYSEPNGKVVKFTLPDIGEVKENGVTTKALKISRVDIDSNNYFFNFNVYFYHHELGSKYGIFIKAPIGYENK